MQNAAQAGPPLAIIECGKPMPPPPPLLPTMVGEIDGKDRRRSDTRERRERRREETNWDLKF